MDQETIRLLITATASVVSGMVGGLIGFLSAQRVAAHTIAGQRQLALDNDVRNSRREAVRPLLELVDTGLLAYGQMVEAVKRGNLDEANRLISEFRETTSVLHELPCNARF